MPENNKKIGSSGQALLLVLLGMAVTLTIVMSVVSRSVTDISISSENVESTRAFSAAEAGVEQSLIIGGNSSDSTVGYIANVTDIAEGETTYNIGSLEAGETATVWFVSHDTNGNLLPCGPDSPCYSGRVKVCWGDTPQSLTGTTPALEIIVYYDTGSGSLGSPPNFGNVRVARFTADAFATRRDQNRFDAEDRWWFCTIADKEYQFSRTFDTSSFYRPLFAKLKLLYNTDKAHGIGVSALDGTFPSQGIKIESVGSSGNATRKVEALKPYKETLTMFEAGVFSSGGGDLDKD